MRAISVMGVLGFLFGIGPITVAAATPLDITFCPGAVARPYPLDSLRGVQGLLLQNAAIINTSDTTVRLDSLEIELLNDSVVVDRRTLDATALASAAKSGKGAKNAGVMELYAFQFCNGDLLGNHNLAAGTTMAPGEAIVVMQQVFAWKGSRDEIRVRAFADSQSAAIASASVPLDPASSRTVFRWPLDGGPWFVAGASFHGTHRWGVPEEFALDIVRLGVDGRSYRRSGAGNSDFHAYGARVVAAATGTVAVIVTDAKEGPPLLRKPDESMQDYYGRIGAQQVSNMGAGEAGAAGEAVMLDHGQGEYSLYAHLALGSVAVKKGDRVMAGQIIGRLGSSGNSTEPHLHFQVCDRPSPLACAALIPTFARIEILNADGPRPLQSGDMVQAAK